MARTATTGLPSNYGREKLPEMRRRWSGDLGRYVRAFSPRVFPGAPAQAYLGASANSTGQTEALHEAAFWELGFFNTPAGDRDGPQAPSDPGASYNTWGAIGASDAFRSLVGRRGVTGPAWASAVEDQAAIGLLDLKAKAAAVTRSVGAALGARTAGSQWTFALGVMGYVVGEGGTASLVRKYASGLSAQPESRRLGALIRNVVSRRAATRTEAHALVRVWQRLECGRLLAAETGGASASWFDLGAGLGAPAQAYLSERYYGGTADTRGVGGPAASGRVAAVVAGVAILAGAGYVILKGRA